jgi:phosphoribosylformylglycinamidine synthase
MSHTFTVTIARKPGLSDPEGATTHKALTDLGFSSVEGVSFGRVITVSIDAPDEATARDEATVGQSCHRALRDRTYIVTIAVVVFPGTNCEHDIVHALNLAGTDAELVWHTDTSLQGADGVVLPGGFAHGDYLRTGAIARFSPVMAEVERLAQEGAPVLGICNGFQVLCEAGLLPGALVANRDLKFICKPIDVRVESTNSVLTRAAAVGQVLRIPLNSYEGNYVSENVDDVESAGQVVLTYSNADGINDVASNPNGSTDSIAGVMNARGNVVGLMPHPERASEAVLGSADGMVLIEGFVSSVLSVNA